MHREAHEWVQSSIRKMRVLDIGSRDVNGTVRDLFPGWDYVGLDATNGPGVDVVANGATWPGDGVLFDCVVCCEVLEHTSEWRAILDNAGRLLRSGGLLILTAAGCGREAHTCDGHRMPDPPTEYYDNIESEELKQTLRDSGFYTDVHVDVSGTDIRATARRA